ncbi:MAG: SpoIID/LytB domain-containing protein [Lachnospiraceae bacterium]|nr:SpoIID/LytB domain-containing protein [Lachnospiraceae bacterium]
MIKRTYRKGMEIMALSETNHFALDISGIIPFQIPSNIRVLISATDYVTKYHQNICLGSTDGMIVEKNGEVYRCLANEQVTFSTDELKEGKVKISNVNENGMITVYSIFRGEENPSYFGDMELNFTEEGIVMINEVELEKYLYLVIPSEMPLSYESEALKAQAVCARTYAVAKIQNGLDEIYFCHLDDSVSSQVYANQPLQEGSVKAVDETSGVILLDGKNIGTTYYFSTSCGILSKPEDIWIKEKEQELVEALATAQNENQQVENNLKSLLENVEGLEQEYPYFRWKVKIPYEILESKAGVGNIKNIYVSQRGESGVAKVLTIEGETGEAHYIGEYDIRSVLSPEGFDLTKHNNEINKSMSLLPSGYFYGIMEEDGYMIYGGGYGHGAGMSQNGANELAKQGYSYAEILKYYFKEQNLMRIYR